MGTLVTYGCFAALALAVIFTGCVLLFFAVAAIRKATKGAPPTQMIARTIAPDPEPARYRQVTPDFEDMVITWKDRKREEKRRATEVAHLEALYGIADVMAKAPGVAAPKDE